MSNDDVQAAATRRRRERLPRPGAGIGVDAPGAGAGEGGGFYAEGFDADRRRRYERALRIRGLDGEIALLRLRIAENLGKEDPAAVKESVALLVRAVATQYRLSQQHQDELYQSVLNVIQGLGEAAGITSEG